MELHLTVESFPTSSHIYVREPGTLVMFFVHGCYSCSIRCPFRLLVLNKKMWSNGIATSNPERNSLVRVSTSFEEYYS